MSELRGEPTDERQRFEKQMIEWGWRNFTRDEFSKTYCVDGLEGFWRVWQAAAPPSVMRADPAPEPLVYPAVQASGEKTLPSRRGSAE